jgi:hypothetical protein
MSAARFAAAALALCGAASAARAVDTVDASGKLVFVDTHDGKVKGLANVRVRLMDENWGSPDQEVATTFTAADGSYRLKGAAGDPYIEFVLQHDHYVDVRDGGNSSYRFTTETIHGAKGPTDFKTVTLDDPIVAHLWAYTSQVYDAFKQRTGQRAPGSDGNVGVVYPTIIEFGSPWTTNVAIHWVADDDGYRALFHEFGHRLREGIDGDGTEFINDAVAFTYARSHAWNLLSNEGFAFNEGWAEYHSTLFDNKLFDPNNVHDFLEGWTTLGNWQKVEGNVAASLLKLSDACGGFPSLWKALASAKQNTSWVPFRKGGIHSYQEFEDAFIAQNPGCKRPGAFCTIDPKTGQCPTNEKQPDFTQFLATQTDRCGRAQVVITNGTIAKGSQPLGPHGAAEFKVPKKTGQSTVVTWRCQQGKASSDERTVCPPNTNYIKVSRGDLKDRLLTIKCYRF